VKDNDIIKWRNIVDENALKMHLSDIWFISSAFSFLPQIPAEKNIYIYTHIHTYICIYTYIYTYIIYIYICSQLCRIYLIYSCEHHYLKDFEGIFKRRLTSSALFLAHFFCISLDLHLFEGTCYSKMKSFYLLSLIIVEYLAIEK